MNGSKLQNRYELREQLGRGGMGVVYRAWDPVLQREVAIKMIPPLQLNRESEKRFQREAQLVAGMDHPAIVVIHDFGRHEGSLFFVMPFVEGTPLSEMIAEGALLLDEILDVGAQVAEALDYSHSRGVIHRDIKPGNIMITRDRRGVRVRVMDFGLARGAAERRLTQTGGLVGTLTNISPEQITSGAVSPRSDIYALGIVLYESLIGEPPFTGAVHSVLYRIVHEPAPSLLDQGFADHPELAALVDRCLEKDPDIRPQKGADLAAALTAIRERLDEDQRLLSLSPRPRSVSLRPTQPILSPLIGRQKEWAELEGRLRSALTGECQFALIEGDAGAGKSRLLTELENLSRARNLRVLRGRFTDQESAIPYQGLSELVQDYFRQSERGTSSVGSGYPSSPSADFSDLAADLRSYFPELSEIRDLRDGGSESSPDLRLGDLARSDREGADPTRLYELLARTLARIGGGKPLVLLIENLHEGAVSSAALSYILRRLGPTPTLIAGTFRQAEIDSGHPLARLIKSLTDDPRCCLIRLRALNLPDFQRLVELELGSAVLRDDLLYRLYEATEGNPYFGRELVRWLLETEGLSRDESGSWALLSETGFSTEALPATIQQAVERRIERLERPLRHLLSLASVFGKSFKYQDLEALVKLSDTAVEDLDEAIDQLLEAGLLEEDAKSRDDRLHFTRGVVRDILYHELSRRKRRSLHRRCAAELETRYQGRLERVYPQLVHHFSAGDEGTKTIHYALLLARKSLAAFSPEDASRALRTALDFVDEDSDPALVGELQELLAAAYRAMGAAARAIPAAESAADAYERAGDFRKAAAAALLAAETAWHARRVDEARRWVDRGIELAQGASSSEGLRRLLTLGATVANLRGDPRRARRYLEDAEKLAPAEVGAESAEIPVGGTLRTVLPYRVHTVDPAELRTDEEFEVAANIFETLLDSDTEGNLLPSICKEWQGSDDGRTFELTLRTDVRFSDGWPLRARDVVEAVERAKTSRIHFRGPGFSAIRDLRVLAEDRILIHLDEPLPIFPALLTDPSTAIVREVRRDERAALSGTGPFVLRSVDGERVVLERNPKYWRGTPSPLDRIELRASLDAAGIAEDLLAEKIDVGRDLLPADLESIQRDPRFRRGLVECTKKNIYFVLFHQAGPTACHREIRRILAGVVRVQDLVWRTLGRFAQPAVCLIPPGILGHDPGRKSRSLPSREATEQLDNLGLERPIRLTAAIHPLFRDRYQALLEAIFGEWQSLGVKVVDKTPTMEDYLRYWSGEEIDVDLLIGRWNADFDDPDTFTYGLFHSSAGRLGRFYSSPISDRLLERARQENHITRRLVHYQRFEELLREDHVFLPLFHDIDYRIVGPRVRRLQLEASPPYVNYARLGVKADDAISPRGQLSDGGTLTVSLPVSFDDLDPARDNVGEHLEVKFNVFETLTQIAEGARVVPWLAAFFEAPGGGSYHFRLRKKVRFHNGRRLTSRDVRYSFERLLRQPDNKLLTLLLPIRGARSLHDGHAADLEGFRILSAEQFAIELERPLAFFPALLTHPGLGIVPEGAENFSGSWRDGPAGTGPFRVVRFDPGEGASLEKNPQYWRPDFPRAGRLDFRFGVSARQALQDFRAGRLSIVGRLDPADVDSMRRDPEFAGRYHESPRLSTSFLAFNTLEGPFSDPRYRRALAATIDFDALLRECVSTGVIRARSLLPPGLLGHELRSTPTPPAAADSIDFRETELLVALHSAYFSQYAVFWNQLRSAMKELGVHVRVRDAADHGPKQSPPPDLLVGRWIADYPDADAFAMGLLHSRDGVLAGLLAAEEIDERILRARRETDPTLRHSIYREIEEILARGCLLIPLFHEQNYRFRHPSVRGVRLGLAVPEVRYEELLPA